MLTDLSPLILDLTGLDDAAIEALGFKTYCDYYLQTFNRGMFLAHDGEPVYFFRSTAKTHCLHQTIDGIKGPICPVRVARVKWIKEFISGNVAKSELWLVPDKRGFDKRCYFSQEHGHVVWLSPRDQDWSFKTAYAATPEYIRRKVKTVEGAELVCRFNLPEISSSEQSQPSLQSDSVSATTEPLPEPALPCLTPDDSEPVREGS